MKQYKNDKLELLDLETKVEIPLALVAENLTMGSVQDADGVMQN